MEIFKNILAAVIGIPSIIYGGYLIWKYFKREKLRKNLIIGITILFIGSGIASTLAPTDKDTGAYEKTSSSNHKKSSNKVNHKLTNSPKPKEYTKELSNLNTGFAADVSYDASTKTVIWIGFDDWKTWNSDELQLIMDKIQTATLRQAPKYNITDIKILVKLDDGTVIAKRNVGQDLIIVNQ